MIDHCTHCGCSEDSPQVKEPCSGLYGRHHFKETAAANRERRKQEIYSGIYAHTRGLVGFSEVAADCLHDLNKRLELLEQGRPQTPVKVELIDESR